MPSKVVVSSKKRVFDGFFKMDEYTVSHERYDGSMSPEQKLLVFERGDAVGVLIYNRDTDAVVLVEQFRLPTFEKGSGGGWLLETMAGMVKDNEKPVETAIRETFEETGYVIENPEFITSFFSSPGGTSERIFLYYAVVTNADQKGAGGGVRNDGEDIRIVTLSPTELFDRLRNGTLEDPKLIIAAYHLQDRLKRIRRQAEPLLPGTISFAMKDDASRIVGIKTGPILDVEDVDVWVNSENTDMMMDRVISRSVSANIRYGGASKDKDGSVRRDTIAEELKEKLGRRHSVRVGTIIETGPGELASKGVKRLLHVAAVDGLGPGKGVVAHLAQVSECFEKVLTHVDKRNRSYRRLLNRDRSILVPLMGAGEGGLTAAEVAPSFARKAVRFHATHSDSDLRAIYLLAYTERDKQACLQALLDQPELVALKS